MQYCDRGCDRLQSAWQVCQAAGAAAGLALALTELATLSGSSWWPWCVLGVGQGMRAADRQAIYWGVYNGCAGRG
jgi:hypothetical protein